MNQIEICHQKILNSFPFELKEDVKKVIEILNFNKNLLFSSFDQTIKLNSEVLKITARIYFDEPSSIVENNLTSRQKIILNCIFLRHHNGYIRQKRLELLLDKSETFIIPFSYQLLGEYIIEILFVLDKHIINNEKNYIDFIKENKQYSNLTKSRVISYWNEYYRKSEYNSFNDYIGNLILNRLNQ